MNADSIVGKCTQEETKDLLIACIDALPEDMLLEVLSAKLTEDQIYELNDHLL